MDQSNSAPRQPPGGGFEKPPVAGSRWFALTDAVNDFLDGFGGNVGQNNNAEIGLVTFGGGVITFQNVVSPLDHDWARMEIEMDTITKQKSKISGLMEEYKNFPLGLGTSIYDGIDISTNMLQASSAPANQYIVLLSDGAPWTPGGRPGELVAAERAAELGIAIYTIAYGTEVRNLERIADITGGQYFTPNNQSELKNAFNSIASTIGVKLTH